MIKKAGLKTFFPHCWCRYLSKIFVFSVTMTEIKKQNMLKTQFSQINRQSKLMNALKGPT